MFVDTSVVVAILADEEDAPLWADRIENSSVRVTSALVLLEAAMRLSTKLAVSPMVVESALARFLRDAGIRVSPIDAQDGWLSIQAFAKYGKGRGHPAQLDLADCLSYACAKRRGMPLLYKGEDFAQTDLA